MVKDIRSVATERSDHILSTSYYINIGSQVKEREPILIVIRVGKDMERSDFIIIHLLSLQENIIINTASG